MSLPRFAFHEPDSLDELFALRRKYGEEARYISGGTALVLLMRAQLLHPSALLSLRRIPGLSGIGRVDGAIRIGAAMTHAELAASPLIEEAFPTLSETFAHVATPRVRNIATVGGNLAHANPAQDPPVTLRALGASAIALGPSGERRIPLDAFFLGYLETALDPFEVLAAVEVPVPRPGLGSAFIKYLPRSADDYATVSVAVALRRSGDRVAEPRIVIGSMGPTPIRATDAERLLSGQVPDAARLEAVGEAAAAMTDPDHDSRGTPAYKRRIAPVIVARAVRQAWNRARRDGS
jgi:carbon-monoxide dehydrogenase medium subunit